MQRTKDSVPWLKLHLPVATMFTFTGATEEAQSLAPPNAHPWDEYFGSLDETFEQPKVATATKVPASEACA